MKLNYLVELSFRGSPHREYLEVEAENTWMAAVRAREEFKRRITYIPGYRKRLELKNLPFDIASDIAVSDLVEL
jgi:hypothetical protein